MSKEKTRVETETEALDQSHAKGQGRPRLPLGEGVEEKRADAANQDQGGDQGKSDLPSTNATAEPVDAVEKEKVAEPVQIESSRAASSGDTPPAAEVAPGSSDWWSLTQEQRHEKRLEREYQKIQILIEKAKDPELLAFFDSMVADEKFNRNKDGRA